MCDFFKRNRPSNAELQHCKISTISLFPTSSLRRRISVLHGSFLLKIRTYIPKLMYFHILLKDFVRNVHLEDVWANTDGAFIVYMFRRPPEVWSLVSYNALISGTGKVGITKPLEGCWYRQGNFLQQLLYHGNIVPSVYSSAIFDAPTACCGINYHINVASHVVHVV